VNSEQLTILQNRLTNYKHNSQKPFDK
jgi:hypothetical protein